MAKEKNWQIRGVIFSKDNKVYLNADDIKAVIKGEMMKRPAADKRGLFAAFKIVELMESKISN